MLQFNKTYALIAIAILLVEIGIASYLTEGFIRHTFGDFLVVILLYCFFKSFINTKPVYLASVVLIIAFIVEFLQRTNLLEFINLQNSTLAKTVLGNTFQIQDLIAYTLGVMVILGIEYKFQTRS